ncbi:hypothetical protein BC937DRAFT_86150 [Endogone sp. FLAS-F59071]|nr:hypothetical protein BC937DRAFT_86150 [Endogone sp. FLAS-F59071]|eukprot:RUS23465.1 hypothetical protein BC937DRAFT_86150 [Endogone sp. FLAS-F59071]
MFTILILDPNSIISWKGATVAITMPSRVSDIIEQVQNFRRLHSCDYIATVYAITQDPRNQHYCLIMKNAIRSNLRQYMKASEYSNLPWNAKCKIAWEFVVASLTDYNRIKFLHDGGVVHGDLNSLNVLINDSGSAIVTGFGHSINHTSLLATGHIHGQVAYTAPEILKYAYHKDAHIYPPYQHNELCDIYSLGVLLWEIAAGRPPFVEYADDSNQLLIQIVENDLREVSEFTDDAQYTTLYQRAWSILPENRPQLIEVVECLDNLRQPNILSACRNGDIQALAWYISRSRNVDARDNHGTGVLDAVCEASDPIPLLRWLLATKIDVVNHGWRAINSICNYSTSVESLKLLFSAGATVIPRPPHLEPPLTELCANIEVTSIVETMKLLVATLGAKIVNEADSNGETALVKLITYRPFDIDALQFLLKYRANANAVDTDGAPILFTALREENGVELIDLLVIHGANTNAKDDCGRSLLHILFDDESVWTNEPDWRKSDLTAVLKMIGVLISYGANVNSRDADGNTPTFYLLGRAPFTSQEIDAIVERLIVEYRADVNATNNRGDSILHVLLGNGWSKSRQNQHGRSIKNVFKLLLSKGADPLTRNNEGLTILHCLYRRPRDFSDETRYITTTAMTKNVDLNAQEYKYGWTTLFMVADSYSKGLNVGNYRRAKALEYLLGMGAEVSITDMNGRTVWAQLISNPHTDTNSMRVLLNHGAKVTFKDEYDHIIPVMHHLATTSNKPLDDLEYIAELLGTISEQSSVEDMLNVAPWRSGTALHALVKRESDFSKAAMFLLKRGVNPATLAPFKPMSVDEEDLKISVVHTPHSSTPDDGIWMLPGEIIGDALTIAANRSHLESVKAILELREECRNLESLRRAVTFARGKSQADICQYLETWIDYEGEYF